MADAPLPSSFDGDEDFYSENRWQKLKRRIYEEPLIPLGCALTVWALVGAQRAMRVGDHAKTNRMFRRRIYAQGFTVVAMGAGSVYWSEDRKKRQEYDTLLEEKKRVEKRDAWLRELEARDEEDKALKKAMGRKRERDQKMAADAKAAEAAQPKDAAEAVDPAAKPAGTQTEVKSPLEASDEKSHGVMDAVRDLVSRKK